jgi:hypothetical protein
MIRLGVFESLPAMESMVDAMKDSNRANHDSLEFGP